ncbi:response regulator [Saccharibacillus kuerlensis]|uniref:AraC family transcriptional regulator n=1 Tax=Saccharibacillus kuerlensis TaxID=459527 RepID=A0ABQ2KUY5_9BACL|nr:response regulator [Saccharibacillus kuerlensis]GGN94140.1 AraC family transcriptional regulator [Saccharibacillus kuerlensis]
MAKRKVLVVDDEAIFRRGLRHLIGISDTGWEVVGEAKDGLQALEEIERLKPELVITDIRMPKLDGIGLQEQIRERYPEIRCFVLSGYNDFRYAQSSLRYGARDYLLKPIDKEELYRVLNQVERELLLKERQQRELRPARRMPADLAEERERLLDGLVRGELPHARRGQLREAGIEFEHGVYCLVAELDKDSIEPLRYERQEAELFSLYIRQFLEESLAGRSAGFVFRHGESAVALLDAAVSDESRAEVAELARQIAARIRRDANLTITIGIGSGVHGVEEASKSYSEARIALLYRLTSGGNRVLLYEDPPRQEAGAGKTPLTNRSYLEQALLEGQEGDLGERVREGIEQLCGSGAGPAVIHEQICRMLLEAYGLAADHGLQDEWPEGRDIGGTLQQALALSSRAELSEYCAGLLRSLQALIKKDDRNGIPHAVDRVVRHIEKHYAEPITLGSMAEMVYLNASYLSSLFKNRLGRSFVEILTEVRVREASKRLLHTDDKIASIAYEAGFSNIRHFNRVFKAETGRTPKEFRESLRPDRTGV